MDEGRAWLYASIWVHAPADSRPMSDRSLYAYHRLYSHSADVGTLLLHYNMSSDTRWNTVQMWQACWSPLGAARRLHTTI